MEEEEAGMEEPGKPMWTRCQEKHLPQAPGEAACFQQVLVCAHLPGDPSVTGEKCCHQRASPRSCRRQEAQAADKAMKSYQLWKGRQLWPLGDGGYP